MPVFRRDDHEVCGTSSDQHNIIEVPGLEQVMCLTFNNLIDLRIPDAGRIFRVIVSLGLDQFTTECTGGDDSDIVPQVVLVEPGPVRI